MTDHTQNPNGYFIAGPTSAGTTTLLRNLIADLAREDTTHTAPQTLPSTPEKKS